jgi:quercetin dioxygenase-like cupin family protein
LYPFVNFPFSTIHSLKKNFMNHIMKPAFIATAIALVFAACNNEEKKTESETTDSTTATTATTEATPQSQDLDATKVAPGLYTLVKDTMGIRVLEVNYKPGDSSAMHSHPDNALYVINGGKGEFTEKDGSKQVVDFKAGMTGIGGAETHSVKNVGNTTLKAILVEVNRPNRPGSLDPAMDATKVASKLYKVAKDSLNIRIVTVDYKPGEVSVLHSHPDLVMYAVGTAKAEFTEKDGTKREMTLEKGMTVVVPADTHSVKNIGTTHAKVVLFEVNRPQQ